MLKKSTCPQKSFINEQMASKKELLAGFNAEIQIFNVPPNINGPVYLNVGLCI